MPSFQGNNAISAQAHLKVFSAWLGKHARNVNYNHEDVKMHLFFLTLEEDALDWFMEKPNNSFHSLQSIINAYRKSMEIREKKGI